MEYLFDCTQHNSLSKIIRITQYALRFVENLLKRKCKFKDGLHYWLYSVQQDEFQEEVKNLVQQKSKTKSSLIKSLGLYIEPSDHLLHCRGRIDKSNAATAKFPILLPRNHHFTKCLVLRIHSQVMHGGTAETLARLRETFWLPKGRQVIKQQLAKCFTCRYLLAKTYNYPGPPVLPMCRVNYSVPFASVGVDYSGHIVITNPDQTISKYYFCLFTCAATRAIHLELARDMTAATFLQLLRRFVARRSCPSTLISDNGKYFTANADFIRRLQDDPSVKEYLQERRIEWKFIPPRSPWMGGFYERLVGVVKRALRLVLFRKNVSEDELQTLLAEIEQRVNNRPLTYIDEDIDNPVPLTPSHLLHGRRLESFPTAVLHDHNDPTFAEHDVLNERFSYLSRILNHWERIWSKEYIASLREKFYGAQNAQQMYSPSVDDVVIIVSEGNRAKWPLGRVTKLHPDDEGIIRIVEVVSRGNKMLKTVEKLVPLESASTRDQIGLPIPPISGERPEFGRLSEVPSNPSDYQANLEVEEVPPVEVTRPTRKAAQRAAAQRRQLIADDQL